MADASSEGQRLENVFSTRSNYDHSRYLKPYQKYFSMNAILAKEHLADSIAQTMCRELEARFVDGANAGKTVDLADWIEYAAWDFDWEMSFGQDMGFLRTGTDVQGLIHTGEMVIRYLGCVCHHLHLLNIIHTYLILTCSGRPNTLARQAPRQEPLLPHQVRHL